MTARKDGINILRKYMTTSIKPVRVSGQLFWSNWMGEFNTKFNEDNKKFECSLGMLSDAAATALEDLNIKIKNKPEQGKFIVGKSMYKFEPVDEEGNPVDIKTIGNGTKCVALVSSYKHKMSAAHGYAPSIKKIIITELVKYNSDKELSEEEDEYIL